MIIICPICKKEHKRSPCEKHNVCCSSKCGQIYRSQNSLAKYNERELRNLYLNKKWPFRKIAKHLGFKDTRRIRNVFRIFGIPIRHGHEAVKLQWVGNDKRKAQAAEIIRSFATTHGKTAEYQFLIHNKQMKEWSLNVRIRDDFTCQKCGKRDIKVHAHHIIPVLDNPEKRLDLSNGQTLCRKCHISLHVDLIRKYHLSH